MKKNEEKKGRGIDVFCFIIFVIIIVVLGVGNYKANQRIFITTYEVVDEKIPQSFDGYRIVQVTDVHSIRSKQQSDILYNKIEQESPDLIVITGDLVDSNWYTKENDALKSGESDKMAGWDTLDFIKRLTANYPVYLVYGNHEMILLDDVRNNPFKVGMEEAGVVILNNNGVEISRDGESIYLLGIQDPATLYKDHDYVEYDNHTDRINAMMENVMALREKDLYTVVLSHRPEYFEEYKKYDADLYLTGHAHGGQIRLPIIGGMYAPGQGVFPKYTSGMLSEDDTTMIIGRGLGNAVKVPRIFNPPELNVVILKRP